MLEACDDCMKGIISSQGLRIVIWAERSSKIAINYSKIDFFQERYRHKIVNYWADKLETNNINISLSITTIMADNQDIN